ncbi:MAG UNVERIFIED_CONTAM: phycobiliprotein lyase [Microcystis novacekii LVE1205-3]
MYTFPNPSTLCLRTEYAGSVFEEEIKLIGQQYRTRQTIISSHQSRIDNRSISRKTGQLVKKIGGYSHNFDFYPRNRAEIKSALPITSRLNWG